MKARYDVARIRALNDQARSAGPVSDTNVRWLLTAGVQAMGPEVVAEVVRAVQTFAAFNADNDPHGEHDLGAFKLGDERLYWKIDYYNKALDAGSGDPADEALTCRVLTILLASEY